MVAWPYRGQRAPNYWDEQLKDYIDQMDAATSAELGTRAPMVHEHPTPLGHLPGVWYDSVPNTPGMAFHPSSLSRFMRIGDTVWYRFYGILQGVTGDFVRALFIPPFPHASGQVASAEKPLGKALGRDVSTGYRVDGTCYFAGINATQIGVVGPSAPRGESNSGWTVNYPWTWSQGDIIGLDICYEAEPLA